MTNEELIKKLGEMRNLVDGLCSETGGPVDLKSTLEELRRVRRLARMLEMELLERVFANHA